MAVEGRDLERAGSLPRDGHQDGLLALGDIAADGLAGPGRVAEYSQHVVTELERDAERGAVASKGLSDTR
jgi:hypothetical protein